MPSSQSQTYSDASKLPPNNPVTPATLSTVPAAGTVSTSLNPGVTAGLIGSSASQAAATAQSVVGTGTGVIIDAKGTVNAAIGVLAQTPQQLEAAGILKPGAGALVTGLIQRGVNVQSAMTNNLFTGMPGAHNLTTLLNNVKAQASAQVVNFQQAQSAMMMTGAITGKEQPGLIAGIINAAAQVGPQATAAFLQNSATEVPTAAAAVSVSMQSSSGSGVPLSKSGGISAGSGGGGLSSSGGVGIAGGEYNTVKNASSSIGSPLPPSAAPPNPQSVGAAYATSSGTGIPLSASGGKKV